jgi:sec-independent protein translocase protein TatA
VDAATQSVYNDIERCPQCCRFRLLIFCPDLLVVVGIAALLFGGKKIPEVAKGLGEGIKNFKQALKAEEEPSVETRKQA